MSGEYDDDVPEGFAFDLVDDEREDADADVSQLSQAQREAGVTVSRGSFYVPEPGRSFDRAVASVEELDEVPECGRDHPNGFDRAQCLTCSRRRRWVRSVLEREEAARKLARRVMPERVNLAELLREPPPERRYLVDGLVSFGEDRNVWAAAYKAGKTIGGHNLARALTDGTPFLDHFEVAEPVRVTLLDVELSKQTLYWWLGRQKFAHPGRMELFPMRGMASSFEILTDLGRARWARRLADCGTQYLIIDCLLPFVRALGLNPDREAGLWLDCLDELLVAAGIGYTTVIHHFGHGQERSKGDSSILAWGFSNWRTLMLDPEDPKSARLFTADGRDVSVPEGELEFAEETNHLAFRGDGIGGRAGLAARREEADDVAEMLRPLAVQHRADHHGRITWTTAELGRLAREAGLSIRRGNDARILAVEEGLLLGLPQRGNRPATFKLTAEGLARGSE